MLSLCLSKTLKTFFNDYLPLRDGPFCHNLVDNSGKTDRIFMEILLQAELWSRKSLLNFGSHPVWSVDLDS